MILIYSKSIIEASSSTLVLTLHCSECDYTQSISEFISSLKDDPEEDTIDENTLEKVIDLNNIKDFIIQIIDLYKLQSEANLENMPPFHFECNLDIVTLNKSTRE
ncbi:17404_t:CDS:2, partial [Cetraspora pellucida]